MTETDDQDKFCPACDARRPWFEDACPECGTALVPLPDRYAKDPEQPLVTVLSAVDPALLPLAKLALDGARIEYTVRHPELTNLLGGREVNTPAGSGDEPWTINVRQSDAARAREPSDEGRQQSEVRKPVPELHERNRFDIVPNHEPDQHARAECQARPVSARDLLRP